MTETPTTKMVIKRDGSKQPFSVDKISARIENLVTGLATKYMMTESCVDKVVKYAHNGKFSFLSIHKFGDF